MNRARLIFLLSALVAFGCSSVLPEQNESAKTSGSNSSASDRNDPEETVSADLLNGESSSNNSEIKGLSANQPKNVKEFFMRLPSKYFEIDQCKPSSDANCQKSKAIYLKKYRAVEDLQNGYMEAGGDGAQGAFKMAIFKRPNGKYLVGLNSFSETADTYRFLEFENGKWADISIEVVPEYSSTNIYELPREGTTIPVYAKVIVEQREGFEVSKKGTRLYDLSWENGEFSIKR